ncbi:2-hydroxyacid dehydrogenase [Aquisalimonas asiatica]|uniref:Glycerate dehydrogenase n=1 Tax=Aquisalimonas asiatica TaxID=406100 RepID=A0A1H8TMF5_9GAMM|nr:2-hydroxyacid dehydrogenase [Aquisalimonas asiatica]SEO91784.1 glycerate dehydrogenase [Aquisalimonas asiatica]
MHAVFLDRESLDRSDLDMAPLDGAVAGLTSYERTHPGEVVERLQGATIAIVNKVVLGREHLSQLPDLKLICIAATGVNNVDLEAAQELGIRVANCRGYGTDSVAQHAIGLMLALATRMPDYQRAVAAGDWGRSTQFCLLDYPIMELAGRTLGLIGLGTLGGRVAELAEAFGMTVQVAQRPGGPADPDRVPLDELLARADVISLHCPLTDATRGLIGAAELARMPSHALLINTARGGLVDEQALADALRDGQIGGAGFDVLTEEPPRDGNVLLDPSIPNLIVTPHSAWGSREARQRIVGQLTENIEAFARGDALRQVV